MFASRHWSTTLVALAVTASAAAAQQAGPPAGGTGTSSQGGYPATRVQMDTAGPNIPKKSAGPKVKVESQDSCKLAYDSPDEVKDAASQLALAQMRAGTPGQKEYLTKTVSKLSEKPDRYAKNPTGQEFLLGQTLVMWVMTPGVAPVMKRGDLGFTTDKDQTVDLLVSADSLFTLVETALPKCAGQTSEYRRKAWVPLIVKVGPLINGNNVDSASKLLDRSLVIYRGSPFSYYFKGQIEYRRDEFAAASTTFEQAVAIAMPLLATNSDLPNIAEYSSFFAGYSSMRAAVTLSGAAQAAAYQRSATLLAAYLKNYPCGRFAENAETSLLTSLKATNDSTSVKAVLTAMTTETKPCTDMWWYNAASEASDMNAMTLAVQLSDKAVAYSPWSAGLANAANVYVKAKEFTKLLPVAARLTQLGPNGTENWDLLALGYQGAAAAATTPAAKQAYKDSLLLAYDAGEKLKIRVRITEFTMDGIKRTAGGSAQLIDNTPGAPTPAPTKKGTKAKPAPAAPAHTATALGPTPVTIKMDFLDRSGAVVTSQATTVTATLPDETKFSVTADGATIVGYRYTLVP